MPIFKYKNGDRPLEGYSIEHGLGRGGFGEVYYAVSDSGREVALKSVQNYEQIELRGTGRCMNLKSPHLVSIFDIRRNEHGEPFIIMEYVMGPSLREVLDDSPDGIGPAKAAFFLREIGKGLTHLHDHGVVHRDLKPHNVFYEQGIVKIGDYSLSKLMTTSHRSGHTVTVGTVHYMAPEISMGRYDHTVDIYALGVLLYEMLTGEPPFKGDSIGEVLMKHVAGEVDVEGIAEPFASVIQKALRKEPSERYQSAQEMVDDLFGAADIEQSVAAFDSDELSMVAERVFERAAEERATAERAAPQPVVAAVSPVRETPPDVARRPVNPPTGDQRGFWQHIGLSCSLLASRIGLNRSGWPDYWGPIHDPVGPLRRLFMAAAAVAMFILVPTIATGGEEEVGLPLSFITIAGVIACLVTTKVILPKLERGASFLYRFVFGTVCALAVLPASFAAAECVWGAQQDMIVIMGFLVLIPMFLLDWRVMSAPIRPSRLSLTPTLFAGLLALFPPSGWIVAAVAVAVQLASKYDPEASKKYAPHFPWFRHLLVAVRSLPRSILHPFRWILGFVSSLVRGIIRCIARVMAVAFGLIAGVSRRIVGLFGGRKRKPSRPADYAADEWARWQTADVVSPEVSPHRRLGALALSVIPIAGLHRFYVGKIRTGIIWLLTLGLFGIGQLIDMVMIALGQFRDVRGRRVLAWGKTASDRLSKPVNEYSAVLKDSWTSSRIGYKLGNLFLNLVGAVLLVITLVAGFSLAVRVPNAIAAGVLPDVNPWQIERDMGMRDWPILVNNAIAFLVVVLGTLGTVVLMFARRESGISHVSRVPLAALGFVTSVYFAGMGFNFGSHWPAVGSLIQERMIGQGILRALRADPYATPFGSIWPPLIFACLLFVAAIFVLAWPARQKNEKASSTANVVEMAKSPVGVEREGQPVG